MVIVSLQLLSHSLYTKICYAHIPVNLLLIPIKADLNY